MENTPKFVERSNTCGALLLRDGRAHFFPEYSYDELLLTAVREANLGVDIRICLWAENTTFIEDLDSLVEKNPLVALNHNAVLRFESLDAIANEHNARLSAFVVGMKKLEKETGFGFRFDGDDCFTFEHRGISWEDEHWDWRYVSLDIPELPR